MATTRRHYTDKSGTTKVYEAHLLRRSYRQDGKVKTQTVGNLSALPAEAIEAVRSVLKGEVLTAVGAPSAAVEVSRSGTGMWPPCSRRLARWGCPRSSARPAGPATSRSP